MIERCVCCGEEIPEGRQVCLKCERMTNNMKHCEDCIHDEVCGMWAVDTGYPFVNANNCVHYKAKAIVKSEAIKEFAERLKKQINSLEWKANTARKTLPIDFVKKQIEWILKDVSIETIDELVQEMVGDEDGE